MNMQRRPTGYTLTFQRLAQIFAPLHMGDKAALARLHDVWLLGAPTPQSRVLLKQYDERLPQAGVFIERVILPSHLENWIFDTAQARSFVITRQQARAIAAGDPRTFIELFEAGLKP